MRDGLPECGACHTPVRPERAPGDRGLAGPLRQARGRRGLDVLTPSARSEPDIRITESEVARKEDVDASWSSWHSRCGPSC